MPTQGSGRCACAPTDHRVGSPAGSGRVPGTLCWLHPAAVVLRTIACVGLVSAARVPQGLEQLPMIIIFYFINNYVL